MIESMSSTQKKIESINDTLRVLINNPFKESFYGKRKKNFNILTTFFISYKNGVKNFLK